MDTILQICNFSLLERISLAKTLLRYNSPDPLLLSFHSNVNVTIFSKEAGSDLSLWGAEIEGKRGYVSKEFVREYKVFKKPKLLVDTELKKPKVPEKVITGSVEPSRVQQQYEVVDGTTLYANPADDISPSTTKSPVLSTVSPLSAKGDTFKEDPGKLFNLTNIKLSIKRI